MFSSRLPLPVLGLMLLMAGPAAAAPTVRVLPTVKAAEKGGIFQIRVEITAEEPLTDLVVAPLTPDGFTVEPIPSPGVMVGDGDPSARLPRLEGRSSVTVAFRVWPPDFLGRPRYTAKEAPYYTRGEPKSFAFNVFYSTEPSRARASLTRAVEIPYTTSIGFYLLAGMLGILLGHVVKTGTKDRSEIAEGRQAATSRSGRVAFTLGYVFLSRLPSLLTSLVIGFGALLAMAKDAIPVASWHQAIALGIGLAVLTDEQLLSKIKAPGQAR